MTFFWVGHFEFFFFQKKKFFFASSPWKLVNIYRLARMGQNFDDYPGFQPIYKYNVTTAGRNRVKKFEYVNLILDTNLRYISISNFYIFE